MTRRGAAVLVAIAVTLLLAFGALDPLELPLRDLALRLLPQRAATQTVVVAIDEESLSAVGPWPWPRATIAQLVDRAADGGARGVVLDVLLAEARSGDEALARAMKRLPAIAVSVLDERGRWLVPAEPLRASAVAAHGNFELDHDGILRRLSSTKQSNDRALTAIAVEAASLVTSKPVAVGRAIAPAFRTRPGAVPQVSAGALLRTPALASRLRGKLVFIGPTALALGDRVLTPVTRRHPDPGVTVHAAATESIIRGEEVRELPPYVGGLLAALECGGLAAVRSRRKSAAAAAALLIGGLLLLAMTGLAVPFFTLVATALLTLAVIEVLRVKRSRDEIAVRFDEHRAHEAESKRVLAHELKTPLASMRGLTQLLGRFELSDAERRRVTALVESEAGKLESMVTGLLDLERLPLRDFAASTTLVDLGALAETRVAFLRGSSDRELKTSIEKNVVVRADATLIERTIDNLVGNALKYSSSDVTVNVRANNGHAILEVEDRGPGLSAEERERVFQRFFRGSTAAGTEGLGLGLSLVAEVARWHGGEVGVDRASGGGSLFRVTLPAGAN